MLTHQLFDFLTDLKANNTKEWFAANKARYESDVREPLLAFVRAFEPRLAEISPYFVASDRKAGGSLFRIHRDVRFSSDKTPYKTNAGVQFRHENGKDAHAPGFYLHLAPDECFCAGGMWRPDSDSLRNIRQAMAETPQEWTAATQFAPGFELGGASLQRPPRGYQADHPLITDLKRKDYIAVRPLQREEITSADFLDRYTEQCRTMAPYLKFIAKAVGQPF